MTIRQLGLLDLCHLVLHRIRYHWRRGSSSKLRKALMIAQFIQRAWFEMFIYGKDTIEEYLVSHDKTFITQLVAQSSSCIKYMIWFLNWDHTNVILIDFDLNFLIWKWIRFKRFSQWLKYYQKNQYDQVGIIYLNIHNIFLLSITKMRWEKFNPFLWN